MTVCVMASSDHHIDGVGERKSRSITKEYRNVFETIDVEKRIEGV